MKTEIIYQNNYSIVVIESQENLITDPALALDTLMNLRYQTNSCRIIIPKEAFAEEFFSLKTGLAGTFFQKMANYRFKLAIVGDFQKIQSPALRDFIRECNRGQDFFFVPNRQEALLKLSQ